MLTNPILSYESLSQWTTFRIGGVARFFARCHKEEDCISLLEWADTLHCPIYLLGGGSNILVADKGIDGLVIRLENNPDENTLSLTGGKDGCIAFAGVALARLVSYAYQNSLSGLEEFAGIPGTVGGALKGNAGGVCGICEKVISIETLSPVTLRKRIWRKEDIHPSYRDGGFGDEWILRATFPLEIKSKSDILSAMNLAIQKKKAVQPIAAKSAGCVFRNPTSPETGERISAGLLIDKAGCKNWREGDALVSDKHANFIINIGNAKASDVMRLIERIEERVYEHFSIQLAKEIQIWP